MKLIKVNPTEVGQTIFEIDNAAFNRDFDLKARSVEEEVGYLKTSELFLAYEDDKPVGMIGYAPKGDHIEIRTVAVIPAYQNRGIGRQMMKEVLVKLKGKPVELVTHPRNVPAIILYLSSGFEIYGWKDNYYGDGSPRLLLKLK